MSVLQNLREEPTGVLAILILGVGLADLFLNVLPGVPFWVVFVVGYAVVLPLVAIALGEEEASDHRTGRGRSDERERAEEAEEEPPLERLKRRYAEGEISDEAFERRLERLLETEDETAATEYLERERRDRDPDRERA